MRRERQQVHAERAGVHRDLGHGLHRVGVEERSPGVRDAREFGDRLNGSDLVVRVHDRYDGGIVGDRRVERLRFDDAGFVDREQRDLPAAAGERLQGDQDGLVLDRRRDQMPSAGRLDGLGGAANCKIVSLGAAAREYKSPRALRR